MTSKKSVTLATAALITSAGFGLLASPAHATAANGCPNYTVCLKSGAVSNTANLWTSNPNNSTGPVYLVLPSNVQNVVDSVRNSRNNDAVWLLDTGANPDAFVCVAANQSLNLGDVTHPDGSRGTWANDVDVVVFPKDSADGGGCTEVTGELSERWRPGPDWAP